MEKIGILVFVSVLFFSCQKSMDGDFDYFLDGLKQEFKIELVEKNEKTGFWIFELLEGEQSSNFKKPFEYMVFKDEKLDEKNVLRKKAIETFSDHKYIFAKDEKHKLDSINTFSLIHVLKSNANNENYSPDQQFLKIISHLEEIPPYFSKAKELIKNPSKEKLELAIAQYSKDYFFLKNELPSLIRKPDILKEDQINFNDKSEAAQLAVKDFVAFLNSHLFEIGDRELSENEN